VHAYSWKPELGARAYFFDRHTLELAADIAIPTMSMYHFINGEFNQLAASCSILRILFSIAADHPLELHFVTVIVVLHASGHSY
jgi:hypothetical protein